MTEPETPNTATDIMSTEHTAKGRAVRKQVAAMQRRKRALEMRASGATYQAIADELGYRNRTSAYDAVASGLKDITREPAKHLRDLELERLDAMQAALWESATQGDPGAIAVCLKIGERRARLWGLYAPTKIEGKVETTVRSDFSSLTPEEKRRKLERGVAALVRNGLITLPADCQRQQYPPTT